MKGGFESVAKATDGVAKPRVFETGDQPSIWHRRQLGLCQMIAWWDANHDQRDQLGDAHREAARADPSSSSCTTAYGVTEGGRHGRAGRG
jgi:hypothetical protein